MKSVRKIGRDAAMAIGRFRSDGPLGYMSKAGGPIRETRAEAEDDYRAFLDARAGEGSVVLR